MGQRGGGDGEGGNGEGETGMGKRGGVEVLARVGSGEGETWRVRLGGGNGEGEGGQWEGATGRGKRGSGQMGGGEKGARRGNFTDGYEEPARNEVTGFF